MQGSVLLLLLSHSGGHSEDFSLSFHCLLRTKELGVLPAWGLLSAAPMS